MKYKLIILIFLLIIILFYTSNKNVINNYVKEFFTNNKGFITFKQLGNFGHLGNQLYQIAATLGTAKKNNLNVVLPEWSYTDYFPNTKSLNFVKPSYFDDKTMDLLVEKDAAYEDLTLNNNKNYDLSGYRQSYLYFNDINSDIINLFTPDKNYLDSIKEKFPILNQDNTVSVHIRRGNYVNLSDLYIQLSDDYYSSGIKYIMDKVGEINIVIVSNDKEWVKNNMPKLNSLPNVYYSPFETQLDDFSVLYLCKYHINANSSYSWWASYLSQSDIVIAPSKYYHNSFEDKNTMDIYPGGSDTKWILIDNNGN